MPVVKFLNGDLSEYDEKDENKLTELIAGAWNVNKAQVKLIKSEEDENVDYFVYFDISHRLLILNMTEENYISYEKQFYDDKGYMNLVKELLKTEERDMVSRWNKKDKIVFVPNHLEEYVKKTYGKVFF